MKVEAQRSESKLGIRTFRCNWLKVVIGIVIVGSFLCLDARLEGEYRGAPVDSISGGSILVIRGGQILIRGIDEKEVLFATCEKQQGKWLVTPIGSENVWEVRRGIWGFRLLLQDGSEEHRFRRIYPFSLKVGDWLYY